MYDATMACPGGDVRTTGFPVAWYKQVKQTHSALVSFLTYQKSSEAKTAFSNSSDVKQV